MMFIFKIYESIFACSPGPDREAFYEFLRSNDRIGSYGIFVVLAAVLLHLIVNKFVFKKLWTFSLILYAFLIMFHFHLKSTTGDGDCGMMYRDSTMYFAILSGFWIIFAPLTMYSVKKYRKFLKAKNSSKPFAEPIESE